MKKLTLLNLISLIAFGCHSTPNDVVENNEIEPLVFDSTEYIKTTPSIILPWVTEIPSDVVDSLFVGEDQIRGDASNAYLSKLTHGDIVVSANIDTPFLRRVVDIQTIADEVVVSTEMAALTDAIYKGSSSDTPPTSDGNPGVIRQALGGTAETTNVGSTTIDGGEPAEGKGPFQFSASPSLKAGADLHFDLRIDPDSGSTVKHEEFTGLSCETVSDCFVSVVDDDLDRIITCENNACQLHSDENINGAWWWSDGWSCNDIIVSLDKAERYPACREYFDRYYDGETVFSWRFDDFCGDIVPPHPIQIEWAKTNCSGALRRLVVDAEASIKPTTGPMVLSAGGSGEEKWKAWSKERRLGTKLIFIGWFPVLLTANAKLDLEVTAKVSAAMSFTFKPIEIENLTVGAGVHYFASQASDENENGVFVDGEFKKFDNGVYGRLERNPVRTPNPRLKVVELSEESVDVSLTAKASAKIELAPRLNLLVYDAIGPYVQPVAPYGEISYDATATTGEHPDRCDDSPSNLCGRAGIAGKVGLESTEIFGSQLDYSFGLYDTCGDFCPANNEFACVKSCLDEDQQRPFDVTVEWDNGDIDLDIELISPTHIDYTEKGVNVDGYTHSGDTCPLGLNGCVDEPVGGKYSEWIGTPVGVPGPQASVQHKVIVSTFFSTPSGVRPTFNLIVRANGREFKAWLNEESPQPDEPKEFLFYVNP